MLDENLPTFLFRPMPDHPHSAVVYFTRSGSDPAPEYVLRIASPDSLGAACHGVYGAALADPFNSTSVVYGEVAVTPDWQLPTLSVAELRDRREHGGEAAAPPAAKVPDTFAVQLYAPDQTVTVRYSPRSWKKNAESWDFSLPVEAFRTPSASRLDRQQQQQAPLPLGAIDVAPRNNFRWKRDGRLGNKDMTCYMVGRTTDGSSEAGGGSSSSSRKDPDITVALFKHGRDHHAVTIYEPNLQRIDVQDRKGLDLVLLLSAQVIRDLYLTPRADPFNIEGAAVGTTGRRRSSQPPPAPATAAVAFAVTGKSAGAPPTVAAAGPTPSAAAIDTETRRLQAMLEREERERARREHEEEKRIKKMLEAEEKEQRRREAEVAKETERLRKQYGVQGQQLRTAAPQKQLPHRPASVVPDVVPPPPPPIRSNQHHPFASQSHSDSLPPRRPASASPASGRPVNNNHHAHPSNNNGTSALSSWWHGPTRGK